MSATFGRSQSAAWARVGEWPLLVAPRRVPPRQAGNFYLLVQISVTKTNDLHTSRCGRHAAATGLWPAAQASNTHLACASVSTLTGTSNGRYSSACGHRGDGQRPSGVDNKQLNMSEETDAVVRCRFSCLSLGRQPFSRGVTAKSAGVQALCFGDFYLGPQMKVTRPPGRNPARSVPAQKLQRATA